jgi:hypothetical protein
LCNPVGYGIIFHKIEFFIWKQLATIRKEINNIICLVRKAYVCYNGRYQGHNPWGLG